MLCAIQRLAFALHTLAYQGQHIPLLRDFLLKGNFFSTKIKSWQKVLCLVSLSGLHRLMLHHIMHISKAHFSQNKAKVNSSSSLSKILMRTKFIWYNKQWLLRQ